MKSLRAIGPEHPWRFSLVIGLGYALAYLVQTWPRARWFWSHSWMDGGDGLVMLWNLWAAGRQGLNFWSTDLIFAPEGVSLLLHSYAPLKGWLGALVPLPLIPSLNFLVILSFATAGTLTFWVARRFTPDTLACLLAGYAFTFTGFHWAHAAGHMNLMSIEVLPLYVLVWLRYEDRRDWKRAAAVAAALLAVALTDYYFAFYCGLLTAGFVAGRRMPWRDVARVVVLILPTTGLLAGVAWRVAANAELLGAHDPATSPLDPVALFVPGALSWMAEFTRPVWGLFAGNVHEHGVSLGLVVWAVILWKGRCRRWWAVFGVFGVLALGERLTVLGQVLPVPLPYQLLEWVFPPLSLGGVPVRMVVMAALAASILFAMGLARLDRRSALLVGLLLAVELAPGPGSITEISPPGWVEVLAERDDRHPLYDPYSPPRWAMAWQTRHGHPISGGQIARTPANALALNDRRFEQFLGSTPDPLVEAGFGYILIQDYAIGGAELLWEEEDVRLYRMVPASP